MDSQEAPPGEGPPVDPDDPYGDLADVLSDRYCREAIAHLGEASGTVEVSDLARVVAARVRGESPDEVPDEVTRRIQTLLHLGHLPTLADHGIVAFDADAGRVRLAGESVERANGEPDDG